jgi:hypothetical protein
MEDGLPIVRSCIVQMPACVCAKRRGEMRGRERSRIPCALGQLEASLADLEGPQWLAAWEVGLREIDQPAQLHLGFSEPLTKFADTLDDALPLVRGEAVHDCRNRVLGRAERKFDAHAIGIVRQVFEQLQCGLVFGDGSVGDDGKPFGSYVRAVRGGP